MANRDKGKFLTSIKKSLMITDSDSFSDDEISLHINACMVLLETVGIPKDVCASDNPLVEGLIMIYVKTFYGFKSDGSVKELPKNFETLLRQLSLTVKEDSSDVS